MARDCRRSGHNQRLGAGRDGEIAHVGSQRWRRYGLSIREDRSEGCSYAWWGPIVHSGIWGGSERPVFMVRRGGCDNTGRKERGWQDQVANNFGLSAR